MTIKPIRLSNTLQLNNIQINKDKEKNRNIIRENIIEFPQNYGKTNIAFCARRRKSETDKPGNVNVKLDELLKLYRKKEMETQMDIPFFSPYAKSVLDTLVYLCSNESCFVFHEENLDSKELFVNALRGGIDSENSKLRKYGFPRGIPFINIDLADYVENPYDAITCITKEVAHQCKDGKKAIIIADNAEGLLNIIDRPYDFINASVFKKYPTVFLTENNFRTLSSEDEDLYKASMYNYKERFDEYNDLAYNKEDALKVISKRKVLDSANMVFLPNISRADAEAYLSNNIVLKYLIGQKHDTKLDLGTLTYTLDLARALAHDKENYFGTRYEEKILRDKAQAMGLAIKLLRNGSVASQIANSDVIRMNDISTALPENTSCIRILREFLELEELFDKNLKEEEERKKEIKIEVISNDKDNTKTDSEQKDKPVKETAENENSSKNSKFEIIKNPQTKFTDVGGMFNVKKHLKEQLIDVLNNPNIKNSQKPNGILLYGPPGSGKTLLASAIAGEAGIPFISTSGSSFVEIYVGSGPKVVREIYEQARKEANAHPSKTAIVFIDEAESATRDRSEKNNSSEDLKTVNALLHEMDGANNKGENETKIITILATNHEGAIDSAIKRSGRIGLTFVIDDPKYSEKARKEIANIHAKDLNFENEKEKEKLLTILAHNTMGMTGADIAQILKNAHIMSLRLGRPNYVTAEDLRNSKLQLIAGAKTDIESSKYEIMQALDHELGHAVNSMILEKVFENEEHQHKMPLKVLDFITSEARGNKLGGTYFKPSYNNRTLSKETFISDLIMLYGGSTAETAMFTTHSSKVKDDYTAAAETLYKAITEYDFGTRKHYIALTSDFAKSLWASEIKEEMDIFAEKSMALSKKIIKFAQPFIEEYLHNVLKNTNNNEDKVILAQEFKNSFNNWLKNSGKNEEYKELCKEIKSEINEFCKEEDTQNKVGF